MNENFGPVLERQIVSSFLRQQRYHISLSSQEYYSTNPNVDKIGKIKGEIDEVKNVMVQNIGQWTTFGILKFFFYTSSNR